MEREKWGSRASFILAAVGSAVGLGNAWRFPGQAAMYGGGTFLVIYILALVIAGFPLLLMELDIGRRMQQGAAGTFRGLGRKMEWIGWSSVGTAFFICTYYAMVLGWVFYMCVKAFSIPTSADPSGIFYNEVLELSSGPTDFGGFPVWIVVSLLIAWVAMYLCIRNGTETVGKVVKFTVFIPLVILTILAVVGCTLPGAGAGLKMFFIPEWSQFGNYEVWVAAFGQVFYSLSIMMAIMIAYGSFYDKKSDLPKDTLIIILSDLLISIIAGIVIFTTMGYMANLNGTEIQIPSSGIGLAFVVYPTVLAKLPGGTVVQTIISVLFYVALLTLAIDSAFSIVEAVATSVSDKFKINKRKTTFCICVIAGIISIVFATRAGLYWLDIVDAWSNSLNLLLVGIIECIAVGWFFGIKKVREDINETSSWHIGAWYDIAVKFICPIMFMIMLGFWLYGTIRNGYEGYPQIALIIGGWLPSVLVFTYGFIIQFVVNKTKRQAKLEEEAPMWEDMK